MQDLPLWSEKFENGAVPTLDCMFLHARTRMFFGCLGVGVLEIPTSHTRCGTLAVSQVLRQLELAAATRKWSNCESLNVTLPSDTHTHTHVALTVTRCLTGMSILPLYCERNDSHRSGEHVREWQRGVGGTSLLGGVGHISHLVA